MCPGPMRWLGPLRFEGFFALVFGPDVPCDLEVKRAKSKPWLRGEVKRGWSNEASSQPAAGRWFGWR